MSLIVDVLKRAQKDAVSIKPPPPFIEYPYKKDLSLKAIISRHVWLFSGAIGFGIIMLFMVFMITRQGGKPTPGPAVSKLVTHSQEFSAVLPEAHTLQEKSAPEQKKKIRVIEPEKKITASSPPLSKRQKDKTGECKRKNFVEKKLLP